jgi:hypothetical protein
MPAKEKEPAVLGHNEETFEYFTKLAKAHKAKVLKQDELMKNINSIEKVDITEVHKIIKQAHDE